MKALHTREDAAALFHALQQQARAQGIALRQPPPVP